MFSQDYPLLADEEKPVSSQQPIRPDAGKKRNGLIIGFVLLLFASNLMTHLLSRQKRSTRSIFAGLEYNVPVAFEKQNAYVDPNQTAATQLWTDINIDAGMVALPDDLSTAHDLPVAQRFPWDDTKSRGLYLLNGHHSLHCIRAIYLSLQEFKSGVEQSRSWGHVLHCADALRQDIICHADDTPRYSTSSDEPESGVGQVRMCRSWERLEKWAATYNSCFSYINQTSETLPELQRYLFCPRESPWREKVVEIFGDQVPFYEDLWR